MLNDTLIRLRRERGFTQSDVANQLHIVRQTLSKWEKGISVPDAEMLVSLAELYGVSVSELLGANASDSERQETVPSDNAIAENLASINEQLIIRNQRSKRVLRTVGAVFLALFITYLIGLLLSVSLFSVFRLDVSTDVETAHVENFMP